MAIRLPDLPYSKDALAPHISANTLEFHYGKHHNTYVMNVNKLINGSELAEEDLETIIRKTAKDTLRVGIYNNAAQVWNHSFYWKCMKPDGGGQPTGDIADRISIEFGSYAELPGLRPQ